LNVIHDMPLKIDTLTSGCMVSDVQFSKWLQDERTYLQSKQAELKFDVLGVEYVELLDKYQTARVFFFSFHFVILLFSPTSH
jgi:hypothetical protein